ncbi:MAG: hypothetical protein ACRD20_19715 [Terriglobales bacterium]
MTSRAVKMKVTASIVRDCTFWVEDDGWAGRCEELSISVRSNSFENVKREMEAALQVSIEKALRKHSGTRAKKVA